MRLPFSLLALVLLAGCGKQPAPAAKPVAPAASPAAAASGAVPEAPSPALTAVSGTILETMDASEYTYMRLKTATGEVWTAVNKARVAKGDTVTVANAMVMDGFQSKTLNRTFDRILFGVLATPGAAAPAAAGASAPPMISDHKPAAAAATQGEMAAQHGQAAGGPPDAPDVKVPKAAGSNAKTIAELWAQRAALKGKEVVVQAKVVKLNANVMGRNWFHVRDGSGSKETKDNDLTVTSDALAKVGDVVTVTGTVAVDKDFGAGYAYPVIVESAKLK
jgi:hypothetical protein